MKSLLLLVSVLILSALSSAHAADAPATTRSSDRTRYAHVVISFDPQTHVRINSDRLYEYLLGRVEELAPKMLGVRADNTDRWRLRIERVIGQSSLALHIMVNLLDDKVEPRALEFADALIDAVRDFAREELVRARQAVIEPVEEKLHRAQAMLADSQKRADELRAAMRKLSDRSDVAGSTLGDAVAKLEEEKQKLELDVLGKQARREAIEKELAAQAKRLETKVSDDPIAAELQKVVEAREQNVERIRAMIAQNLATPTELTDAIGRAAEARAKLLERKRDAANEAGGDVLTALNRELLTLSIDLREMKARLDYINERLPNLRKALDLVEPFNRMQANAAQADKDQKSADLRLRELQELLAEPPAFSVIERSSSRTPEQSGLFGGGFGGGGGGGGAP